MATGALARAKFRSGNGRALLVRYSDAEVAVPEAAFQFEGFRAWTLSDRFPQEGRISFIDGEVIVDISQEEITTHALVRTEIVRVLASINVDEEIGLVIGDGARVVHQSAGVSNIPDTVVVSYASLESGRVAMTPRKDEPEQKIELVGAPDLVVEIVSDSSVIKDEKKLRAAYHAAGIPEYWLIDARGEAISFQILSQRRSGYVAVPVRDGWVRSNVFDREFRLRRKKDRLGMWQYRLETRGRGTQRSSRSAP